MTTAKKRKLPSDFHGVEVGIKRPRISGQEITLLNSNPYPDNFYVGQAIGNGSCFFDSFRQSLEQQTGEQVTAEKLRNDCREFAQKNPPKWFTNAIVNSHDNNGQHRSETVDDYTADIMRNSRWGDPDVEGRILCEKYDVKLHVIEDQSYFKSLQREVSQDRDGFNIEIKQAIMASNSNEALAKSLQEIDSDEARKLLGDVTDSFGLPTHVHYLISSSGSIPVDSPDYNDQDTIYIVNNGESHFEPLLDINKSLAKQLQEETKLKQEQEDFLLAKKFQVDEILEYCNLSKDNPKRAEVEKRFDELLTENAGGKICDVVGQCVSDIKQRIEQQNPSSLLSSRCGMESMTEQPFHPQQILVKP